VALPPLLHRCRRHTDEWLHLLRFMAEALSYATLNDDEQAYAEQYDELADDGSVTENERKLLTFASTGLGISDERAAELESAVDSRQILIPSEEE
jgi:hypothetical protein